MDNITSEGDSASRIVEVVLNDNLAVVSMVHRPYNLSGPVLYQALLDSFTGAVNAGARAILLKSGLKHFCAGADVSTWEQRIKDEGKAAFDPLLLLRGFEELPVPIVAAVHGACLGGGLEIALACDIIICSKTAKLGSVEVALGIHPLLGGIQRHVQRMGAARAREMVMLGHRYDAETLERWGLINRVVPDEQLDSVAMTIAQELAHGPTIAHAATKKLVNIAVSEGVDAADRAMFEIQKPIWASQDLRQGLDSFIKNGPGLVPFKGK